MYRFGYKAVKNYTTLNKSRLLLIITLKKNNHEKENLCIFIIVSNAAAFCKCPSPAEELNFTWDAKTGKVSSFYWNHGGVIWLMYTNTPIESTVMLDLKTSYYYNVDLYVTTKGFETTAYKITAKLTINALRLNGATLGGVYEGTGTAWLGANGTITGN
jgi:hypothetical protein